MRRGSMQTGKDDSFRQGVIKRFEREQSLPYVLDRLRRSEMNAPLPEAEHLSDGDREMLKRLTEGT